MYTDLEIYMYVYMYNTNNVFVFFFNCLKFYGLLTIQLLAMRNC